RREDSTDAVAAGALSPDHSSCKLLRSTTVPSASRNSKVRFMTPTKPCGGVIPARSRSAPDSRQAFGPAGMPAPSADPGASPSTTTLTFKPASQYDMVNGAGSSARNTGAAATVKWGIDVGARAVSEEATGSVAGTACSASVTGDGG